METLLGPKRDIALAKDVRIYIYYCYLFKSMKRGNALPQTDNSLYNMFVLDKVRVIKGLSAIVGILVALDLLKGWQIIVIEQKYWYSPVVCSPPPLIFDFLAPAGALTLRGNN